MNDRLPVDEDAAMAAVRTLLFYLGEDPDREGLKDTPKRVLKAWKEFTTGYAQSPGAHLERTFHEEDSDQMVVVRDIPFASHCEHHMVAFTGHAHIGYIPRNGKVVGLSKLARVLDGYARRLQIQERLTAQVATAIEKHLNPVGVGVILMASHACMCIRGVQKPGSMTITTAVRGAIADETAARAEFMAACHRL